MNNNLYLSVNRNADRKEQARRQKAQIQHINFIGLRALEAFSIMFLAGAIAKALKYLFILYLTF